MKNYLYKITSDNGATAEIVIDSDNLKPVFIYYCGSDSGVRYERIGNAARCLEKLAANWEAHNFTIKREITTPDKLTYEGCSKYNNALLMCRYCGKSPAPVIDEYMSNGGIYPAPTRI